MPALQLRAAGDHLLQASFVMVKKRCAFSDAGIRIFCTEERSQLKNRERAMQILRSRLFDLELQKQQAEIAARRKSQVWSLALLLTHFKLALRFDIVACCIAAAAAKFCSIAWQNC